MLNNNPRYQCQMQLPQFGEKAQQLLAKAKVLIVGAGGLGCPVAQYLGATGVGHIAIIDPDTVQPTNLHRQILYTPADIGTPKALVATQRVAQQNNDIHVEAITEKLNREKALALFKEHDIIVDCTDNITTKYIINDVCEMLKKAWVYGAIYQYEGQIAVWNYQYEAQKCSNNYREVFPDIDEASLPNCAEGGVLPTLAGIIGCWQANEVIKIIIQSPDVLYNRLLTVSTLTGTNNIINFPTLPKAPLSTWHSPIETHEITWQTYQQNADSYMLIDVRSTAEHTNGNLGGINIPLDSLEKFVKHTIIEKSIVFYCSSGTRSAIAVQKAKTWLPHLVCYSLKNGINGSQIP
ncbi:MAG: thiamine biosynthesis protein [Chitinophagia bacterium]|nr:thiamine biosynthesis protein [Chitinophagia bacterium]